jgi:hypothetical protein
MTKPSYFQRAIQRAQCRKSRWNLLLLVIQWPVTLVVWWLLFRLMLLVQSLIAPQKHFNQNMTNLGEILMIIPLFIPAIGIGMMAANLLVWLIPPARAALNKEAAGHAGTDLRSSMKQLGLATVMLAAIALPLSLLGALDPF